MKTLGAVLAGGRSRRFGSDKAAATIAGQTLLRAAVEALGRQCSTVVIVGRTDPLAPCIPDWCDGDLGPLNGLTAALDHAAANRFDQVLTCGVDSWGLPADLLQQLTCAPLMPPCSRSSACGPLPRLRP